MLLIDYVGNGNPEASKHRLRKGVQMKARITMARGTARRAKRMTLFAAWLVLPSVASMIQFLLSTTVMAQAVPLAVHPWVGQTLDEVAAKLGTPVEAEPLRETGGKLLIWVKPNGDSYVFETDASGHVVDAYVKHGPGT